MCTNCVIGINRRFHYYARKFGSLNFMGKTSYCYNYAKDVPVYFFLRNEINLRTASLPSLSTVPAQSLTRSLNSDIYFPELPDFNIFCCYDCGHCEECLSSKVSNLCSTVSLALYDNTCRSLYLTLTYDDEHLPSIGLNPDDIDVFLYMLRNRIKQDSRYSIFNPSFKYFVVGEYGTQYTRRPHYHALFINFLKFSDDPYSLVTAQYLLFELWQKCLLSFDTFRLEEIYDFHGVAAYLLKYFNKQDSTVVPDGCTPLFYRKSINMHASYFRDFCDFHRSNPEILECSFTALDGTVITCPMPHCLRDKLFPSRSLQVGFKAVSSFKALYFIDGVLSHLMSSLIAADYPELDCVSFLPLLPPVPDFSDYFQCGLHSFILSDLPELERYLLDNYSFFDDIPTSLSDDPILFYEYLYLKYKELYENCICIRPIDLYLADLRSRYTKHSLAIFELNLQFYNSIQANKKLYLQKLHYKSSL